MIGNVFIHSFRTEDMNMLVSVLLNTNVRMFTRMVKVISLMSYCTMLDIIALVDVWKVAVGLS